MIPFCQLSKLPHAQSVWLGVLRAYSKLHFAAIPHSFFLQMFILTPNYRLQQFRSVWYMHLKICVLLFENMYENMCSVI